MGTLARAPDGPLTRQWRTAHGTLGGTRIASPDVRDIPESASNDTGRHNIEVWNDLVSPRDLVICLLVAAACTVAAVLISSRVGGQPLFWGLGASVVGFTVNCFLVAPKREVTIVDEVPDTGDDAGQGAGEDGAR